MFTNICKTLYRDVQIFLSQPVDRLTNWPLVWLSISGTPWPIILDFGELAWRLKMYETALNGLDCIDFHWCRVQHTTILDADGYTICSDCLTHINYWYSKSGKRKSARRIKWSECKGNQRRTPKSELRSAFMTTRRSHICPPYCTIMAIVLTVYSSVE